MPLALYNIGRTAVEVPLPTFYPATILSNVDVSTKPPTCSMCPYVGIGNGFVPDWVPTAPKIAFLAQSPGDNEMAQREPLVGASGKFFIRNFIERLGYVRNDILIANVLHCHSPDNVYPTGVLRQGAERHCRQYSRVGNKTLEPGGLVGYAPDWYVLTYHPAFIRRTWHLMRVMQADVEKAFRFAAAGKRVLVCLGDEAKELLLPNIVAGITKYRGHFGPITPAMRSRIG